MTKKNKPQIKLGFMESLSIVSSIFIFVLLIKNSSLASNEVINALKMCASTLIPSIFPLTVASEIITNSGAIEKITQKFSSPRAKLLGVNKFFTATLLEINGETSFENDERSFRCITCLDGEGRIGGVEIRNGESLFVPAGHEEFVLEGKFTAIMTTVRKYFLRVEKTDTLKASVVDDRGEIIKEISAPTSDVTESEIKERVLRACGLTASDVI